MNAEEAGLVFWGVGIFACGVVLCYCFESKDDQEDNDQPRPTFQELIRTLKFPEENNPSRLGSIPTVHFNSLGSKGCLECVVCLSDFAHGEEAKVLPKCDHWFHVKCIDTWFESHSTCPICRNIVGLARDLQPPLGLARDLQPPPRMVANLEVMIDIPVGA